MAGAGQGSFLTPVDTTPGGSQPTCHPFPRLPPTSHIRLLFLQISTCSGAMTRPVKGPISVPALIHVLEKMPRPSPGMELWAMITSTGSTRLDSFCTSVGIRGSWSLSAQRRPCPSHPGRALAPLRACQHKQPQHRCGGSFIFLVGGELLGIEPKPLSMKRYAATAAAAELYHQLLGLSIQSLSTNSPNIHSLHRSSIAEKLRNH